MSSGKHKKHSHKKMMAVKTKEIRSITYTSDDVFTMMGDTGEIIAQENATRLSSMGPAAVESDVITDSVEFWKWMDRNYEKSGIFASSESMESYMAGTTGQRNWAGKTIQGKRYEWDWMSNQRKQLKNLFKTYNAGDIANRPGSDITVSDHLSRTKTEQQLKAYTSKTKPHLKNTPKDMTVVTNIEKVEAVKEMGYSDVIAFGDNESIRVARVSSLEDMATGKATPNYGFKNVGFTVAKAGIMGFSINVSVESIVSYRKWKEGKISTEQYLKEIMKSGGNAGVTSSFSAGIMIPITAAVTSAGITSFVTIPVSYVITAAVDKVVAPAFARGDYLKILTEAKYYQNLIDYCEGLIIAIDSASVQYEQFISDMTKQMESYIALRGEVINTQALKDFEYYANLPKQKAGMVIASMVSLLEYTDDLETEIEYQSVYQRVFKTVIGKNKATKEEIRRNHDRLVIYITKAISILYERQSVDERVTQILGNQILQLCSDNIELESMIRLVDSKIDSIKSYMDLISEINLGMYDGMHSVVALCEIMPQVDSRLLHDLRELRILKVALSKRGILNGRPYTVEEFLAEIDKLSESDKAVVYAGLTMRRRSIYARMILSYIENVYFIDNPLTDEKMGVRNRILNTYGDIEVVTINDVFASLLDDGLKKLNDQLPDENKSDLDNKNLETFAEAMRLFYDGKLIEAFPLFQEAASKNVPRAFYYVAVYYESGYGHIVAGDEKAKAYLEKGMELGEPLCAYKYGQYKFIGSESQNKEWRKQHIKSVERLARHNDPAAIYENGWHFIMIDPVGLSDKAISYFEKAANLGYWPAAFDYYQISGAFAEIDQQYGITPVKRQDYSSLYENVEWYIIQTLRGRYYTLFDRKDMKYYKAAANCFKKSLWLQDEGNPAAGYMAFLLNTGLVPDSIQDAIFVDSEPMYFRAGIECGNPLGLYDLGMLYFEGIGEKHQGRNYEKAFTCLSRSYEIMPKGYVAYVLGIMYYNGDGTKQDFNKTFKYLSEALDMGEKHSLEVLSICYENGLGTEKDLAKANEMKKQAKEVEDTVDGIEIVLSYLKSMAEYCNDKNGAI